MLVSLAREGDEPWGPTSRRRAVKSASVAPSGSSAWEGSVVLYAIDDKFELIFEEKLHKRNKSLADWLVSFFFSLKLLSAAI